MISRYRKYPNTVPAFWAKPEVAARWLAATGWELRGDDRAYKPGKRDIPAPVAPALYDLHDVAYEEGQWSREIVRRIVEWAKANRVEDAALSAGCPEEPKDNRVPF
jgi:hypothetical protein